jgi:ribokinase
MTRIAVLGSVNLDIVASGEQLPRPGETVTGAVLARHPGGKGANQALAARRLGADVSLIACVGRDAYAEEALALLEAEGVDLSGCQVDAERPTGVALIAVAKSGENQIVVAPGANLGLRAAAVRWPNAAALICQLEIASEALASAARTWPSMLVLNLAPARHIDAAILQRADLIVVNETEFTFYGESLQRSSRLLAATAGRAGAKLYAHGAQIAAAAAPTVEPVDTTGAGDAFVAALTLALIENQTPQTALRFACAAGAAATLRAGAQPSLPRRADVLALLAS